MTYNDIATPIKKTMFGEADIIYSFLTAHHGKIDAIAKGIRKTTSRKRGNIDFGVFSDIQFAKGKNMDTIIEAQIVSFNDDLLLQKGLKFLYDILPLINKFATDVPHSNAIFQLLTENFMTYSPEKTLLYENIIKYSLLDFQNILPEWNICYICRVKYDSLNKYNSELRNLICNNCARKKVVVDFIVPESQKSLLNYDNKDLKILLEVLNSRLKEIFPKLTFSSEIKHTL